ncbi:MAG: hypothetical protein QXS72_07970 [Candidatus Caldarchaeum sp.]
MQDDTSRDRKKAIDMVVRKHRKEWMNRYNAIAIGRGLKIKNNQITDIESIVFFVPKKYDAEVLKTLKIEIIPKELEGYPTDVVEVPEGFKIRSAAPDDRRYRPITGGIACINAKERGTGTLAIINSKGELLSNNHVLAMGSNEKCSPASRGDPIIQPGAHGGGRVPDDVVAELDRWGVLKVSGMAENPCKVGSGLAKTLSLLPKGLGRRGVFKYVYSLEYNRIDAAVATATSEYVANVIRISPEDTLTIDGVETERAVGEPRAKRGRTTGYTTGKIYALDVTVPVSGYACNSTAYFENQVAIVGDSGSFSKPGDSGSLVFKHGHATELLFAGGETSNGIDITIASPIEYVISELNYKIT